ncbi:MAG: hypothetical protein ACYCQI_02650 [Gammaproteobacteria bacterium]
MSSFFFVSTYDKISSAIIRALLNIYPDIECTTQPTESIFPSAIPGTLDEFMLANKSKTKTFTGNIGNFPAFELQDRMLDEKTRQPFKKVKLLVPPILRARFLMFDWLRSGVAPEAIFKQFHEEIIGKYKSLEWMKKYRLFYYYHQIASVITTNTKNLLAAKEKSPNPEIDKKLALLSHPYSKVFYIALTFVLAFDSADLPCTAKNFSLDKLLVNQVEFTKLYSYLTGKELVFSPEFSAQFQAVSKDILDVFNAVSNSPWNPLYTELVEKYITLKLDTVYSPHLNKSIAEMYADCDSPLAPKQPFKPGKIVSIQLNSNRPAQLSAYFDNIEETADNPQDIEVVVNIDFDDHAMKSVLNSEMVKRKFTVKYIETPKPDSFYDMWKPLNKILSVSDPHAYFLLNISDEMFFLTKGWDTILHKYVGFFPDHIFRLRTSRNKFRNYFDRWECNFIQDSIPFTTRKWVTIGNDWNPCFGPDSFQQLVAFYLAKDGTFGNDHYLRDIPIIDIQFAGDIPSMGINFDKHWKMMSQAIRAMQICQSYKMQLEAKRRAMLLKANILLANKQVTKNVKLADLKRKKQIQVFVDDKLFATLSYKLSWIGITLTNQWRKLYFFSYFGGGMATRPNPVSGLMLYLKSKYKFVLNSSRKMKIVMYKLKWGAKKKALKSI